QTRRDGLLVRSQEGARTRVASVAYRVEFAPAAARAFRKLPQEIQASLKPLIDRLANEPRPQGSKKLKGTRDQWRVRHGDCRVIYQVKEQQLLVLILKLGHRREVYRMG